MARATRFSRSSATQAQTSEAARRNQRTSLQGDRQQSLSPAPAVQAGGALQRWKALAEASPRVSQLQRLRARIAGDARQQVSTTASGNGLPKGLQRGIEALSGLSMAAVRVHYNSSKPAQLNAHAYAQGSEIHLGPGQERHLPHEAWHVVQQAQGRVRPTLEMAGGVAVNDDAELEREADVMGARATIQQ